MTTVRAAPATSTAALGSLAPQFVTPGPQFPQIPMQFGRPGSRMRDSWASIAASAAATRLSPALDPGLDPSRAYLERTRIHRKRGTPRFIDKMPNNFTHVGFIGLILPRARIIGVRRHPLGACFSAFKQHFAQGQTFSYELTELNQRSVRRSTIGATRNPKNCEV